MIGRLTIGDLGIAAFPGSCLLQEDGMWLSNRGPLRFAREQEGHQTAEMVAGKLQQQQSVDGAWGWLMGEKNDAPRTALSLYALQRSGIGDLAHGESAPIVMQQGPVTAAAGGIGCRSQRGCLGRLHGCAAQRGPL